MEDTKSRILHSALALFAERGTDGGSMREIARRAGVNVATAYHHFGSKRGLLLAILNEYGYVAALQEDPIAAASRLKGNARSVLEQMLFETWSLMAVGAAFIRLLVSEALKGDPDARSIAEEFRDRGERSAQDVFRHRRIVSRSDAPGFARQFRYVVWAVFFEGLTLGHLDEAWLRAQAREASAQLARSIRR